MQRLRTLCARGGGASETAFNAQGQWSFVPAVVGFILGALFVYAGDVILHRMGKELQCACFSAPMLQL